MRLRMLLTVGAMTILATALRAAVPTNITVQGKLTNALGDPLPGPTSFIFRIFSDTTGGAELWPGGAGEMQTITVATDGLWVGMVGGVNPLNEAVFADASLWLEISAGGTTLPRVRLATGPFAFRVATVDGASGGSITSKVSIGSGHTNTGAEAFVAGEDNVVTGDYAAIGGGQQNEASGTFASVGGGRSNFASGPYSTLAGGDRNIATGQYSVVGGGLQDSALGDRSTIGGGQWNVTTGTWSSVGGGGANYATGALSTIAGGNRSIASGPASTVGGGEFNRARGSHSTVAGGGSSAASDSNSAVGNNSAIGGGLRNSALGEGTVIGGGYGNTATGNHSVVTGGYLNHARGLGAVASGIYDSANGYRATVSGGELNRADTNYATIGGGYGNYASGEWATVSGGFQDTASGSRATIGGGQWNVASNSWSTVGGGGANYATGQFATVGGGNRNIASGLAASAGGGDFDTVSGDYATVPGGKGNKASGNYSLGAGRRAKALHIGAFVWSDSSNSDFASTAQDQFLIRASGGVGIGINAPGAPLHVSEGSAGAGTAYTNAVAAFERNGNAYLHLLSPDADENGLLFGTPAANLGGAVIFNSNSVPSGLEFRTNTNDFAAAITATGRMGIGTSTIPNILTLPNVASVDGRGLANAWSVYSSRRWKTDIHTIENPLSAVKRLRGVTYRPKDGGDEQIGMIAEEVGEVVPQVVQYETNGVDAQSIDYARLVALLVEGMKEQQKRIEALERKLERQTP